MEMFVLSYVNVPCIYPSLSSTRFRLKDQNQRDKPVCYTPIVLLIYVNETVYLYGNLPFFKILINRFMVLWPQEDSPGAKVISKCILWVRGLVPFSEF